MFTNSGFRRRALDTAAVLVIVLAGLACVLYSGLSAPRLRPSPLFPLLRTSIEGMTWQTLAALAALGLLAGLLTRLPVFAIGLASIATLPVGMVAEIFYDPTSHNMFPFEFVVYLLLQVPALLGALLGLGIRWLLIERRHAPRN